MRKINPKITNCRIVAGQGLVPIKYVASRDEIRVYIVGLVHILRAPSAVLAFEISAALNQIIVFTCKSIACFDLHDYSLIEKYELEEEILWGTLYDSNFLFVTCLKDVCLLLRKSIDAENADEPQKPKILVSKTEFSSAPMCHFELDGQNLALVCPRSIYLVALDRLKVGLFAQIPFFSGEDKITATSCIDGKLALGTYCGMTFILDIASRRIISRNHWHAHPVTSMYFDEGVLYSGGHENTVLMYNFFTQKQSTIPRLIPSASLSNLKENLDFPIVSLFKDEDKLAVAFEHKIITINIGSSSKEREEINLLRYTEKSYAQQRSDDGVILISDGFNIDSYSPNFELKSSLQVEHDMYCPLYDGLCVYKGKILYFYQYGARSGELALQTSMHLQYEIKQLIMTPDSLITVNSNCTFSLYKQVPVKDAKKKSSVMSWKLTMVNEYKREEILSACIEDDLLIITYKHEVSLWNRNDFEFCFSRGFSSEIQHAAVNGHKFLVICKDEVIFEDLITQTRERIGSRWNVFMTAKYKDGFAVFVSKTEYSLKSLLLSICNGQISKIEFFDELPKSLFEYEGKLLVALKDSLLLIDESKQDLLNQKEMESSGVHENAVLEVPPLGAPVQSLFGNDATWTRPKMKQRIGLDPVSSIQHLLSNPCHMQNIQTLYSDFMEMSLKKSLLI